MILGHRRRHLATFGALALLVPAGLIASVLGRAPAPVMSSLPSGIGRDPLPAEVREQLRWSRQGPLWDELGIELARVPSPDRIPRIAFHPTRDLRAPKVLAYWAPGPGPSTGVPGGAELLGALSGTDILVTPLPTRMRDIDGRFLVYSMGHQRVLGEGPTRASASAE